MLKFRNQIPLDYSLCTMTVTVYHREGLTRQVLEGVHYEFTDTQTTAQGRSTAGRDFLLVVPGGSGLKPGDKVVLGLGPELTAWEDLNTGSVATLGVAKSVRPRYFRGRLCHTEIRG